MRPSASRLESKTAQAMRLLWPLPVTLIGLLLALLIKLCGGCLTKHGIAWEATGGTAPIVLRLMNPWANIQAITLGHIIIARDAATAAHFDDIVSRPSILSVLTKAQLGPRGF